jgi:hypothetical protein
MVSGAAEKHVGLRIRSNFEMKRNRNEMPHVGWLGPASLLECRILNSISPNGHDALHGTRLASNSRGGQLDRNDSATPGERTTRLQHSVFAEAAPLHSARETRPVRRSKRFRYDQIKALSNSLFCGMPEQRLGPAVHTRMIPSQSANMIASGACRTNAVSNVSGFRIEQDIA